MNTVITIGRQYGSGGRDIGMKIAEKFGIPFYDKEILTRASKESGLCQEIIAQNEEKGKGSFFYSLLMDTSYMGFGTSNSGRWDMPIGQKIFLAEFETIKRIAEEGPCVIVGRCADYILEELENVINVYVHAPLDKRVKKIMKDNELGEKAAFEKVVRTDKERLSYYNYYTNRKWGDLDNFDLTVNTGKVTMDGAVQIICDYVDIFEKNVSK